jgi:hypothetical protein
LGCPEYRSQAKRWPDFFVHRYQQTLARQTDKAIEVGDEIIFQASEWIQAPKNFTV